PNYDDRKWTYGFLIGLHTTSYQIKYADNFITDDLDTVHSVIPDWKPGFSLGFIVNYRVNDYLDIRLTPEVAFYEHTLRYNYTDGTYQDQLVETTMVEFPFLLKYKSLRRGNVRMYVVGGAKPGIEASGKKELENISDGLEVKNLNMSLEAGIGLDLYFPLFKFSPEIRFSRGVSNILDNTRNDYGKPLKYVNTNTITIYLLFQ
ncbi:MAG: PorT family protein, partial [Cyclobacteriaceae bacterium]|nr:PorT family protein [Cyclobacteriaceae bacterium]